MKARSSSLRSLLLSAFFLQSCAVGEDYSAPLMLLDAKWFALEQAADAPTPREKTQVPAREKPKAARTLPHATPAAYDAAQGTWWLLFQDAYLADIMAQALAKNNEIKIARHQLAEAKANAELSYSGLFPQIDARASKTRGTLNGAFGDQLDTSSQRGISGHWEIDAFGATRRRIEAAEAAIEAAEATLAQTQLQLVAQVARGYVALRTAQEQERLVLTNLELQQRSLNITKAQRREQTVSDLDLYRAQAQVRTTEARLPQIKADRFAALNRLAVLLATTPQQLQPLLEDNQPVPAAPLQDATAAPIDAIRNRPDIRTAERRLAQATALKAAAFADFFPRVTLDGFFGSTASVLFGNSNSWNSTLGGVFPLLNFGRLQGQLHLAEARKKQAFYSYKQAVLSAVEEVENGFYAYRKAQERSSLLGDAAQAQAKAAEVARAQYISGIGQQLDLLDAERGALDAQINHVQAQALATTNLIQLYTALALYKPSTQQEAHVNDEEAAGAAETDAPPTP